MATIEPQRLLERLAAERWKLSVVATGGGSGGISALCETPGASRVVVEGLVPYARESIDRLLGGPQEHYCSERTARRLATVAWQRAADAACPRLAVGAAVTASLVTLEPKRGTHRAFVAVQTGSATHVASVELVKGWRSRDQEEAVAAALLLWLIASSTGPQPAEAAFDGVPLAAGETIDRDVAQASASLASLFVGESRAMRAVPARSAVGAVPSPRSVVFPGSFDPLHDGHRLMARLAEEIAEGPVAFELSITNVEKPMLDFIEIRDRLARFPPEATVWLTRAATFLEKTEIFPDATFVLGADTFKRLGDPRYYGGSREAADAAVKRIASAVRGLVVFGRASGGAFEDAASIDAPAALREKCYFVSQREFRLDVSSTDIRRRAIACETP